MDDVRIIKNFISSDEILFFKKLIDDYETKHIDKFFSWQDRLRIGLAFGNSKNDIQGDVVAQEDLKIFKEQENTVKKLFHKIETQIKQTLFLENPLYVCSFWLSKQYPGGMIPAHNDADHGANLHFEYSGIVYLNTLEQGGELSFIESGYSYRPEEGDFVFFPTQSSGYHGVSEAPEIRYSMPVWVTYDETQKI
jgi:hypothetical protein